MNRILRMTCMSCGTFQRLKVNIDTEDTTDCRCGWCKKPGPWMSLPTINVTQIEEEENNKRMANHPTTFNDKRTRATHERLYFTEEDTE